MRAKFELPQSLVQYILSQATEAKSPSQVVNELIHRVRPDDLDVAVGSINLTLDKQSEAILQALQEKASVKRNGQTFPGSKHKVLQTILEHVRHDDELKDASW